jgi:nucleotidyltransferase substrate binding protein (TIGR01987 family)
MEIDPIITSPLLKAFGKFEQFRVNLNTEQEQAGAIWAFKCCFELTWKIMKRLLQERGKIVNSPRETFRMAALEDFILDPEIWFAFLVKRNLTVHTYEEQEAKEVLSIFPLFSREVHLFLTHIKAL